jgi:hypothetical protein
MAVSFASILPAPRMGAARFPTPDFSALTQVGRVSVGRAARRAQRARDPQEKPETKAAFEPPAYGKRQNFIPRTVEVRAGAGSPWPPQRPCRSVLGWADALAGRTLATVAPSLKST